MLDQLKKSFKHSGIYALGNMGNKLVGIILLPLYTNYFPVSEYGVLSICKITILILVQVFLAGLPNAYLRFQAMEKYVKREGALLFTAFALLGLSGLFCVLTGYWLSGPIGALVEDISNLAFYLQLIVLIVCLRLLANLSLAMLRAHEQSVFYAVANLLALTLNLSLNIYFIVSLSMGIEGILYAFLISDAFLMLVLLPPTVRRMTFSFDLGAARRLLSFGMPLIVSSLAGMLLSMGDRYILAYLKDTSAVGIYDLAYSLSGVITMFLLQPVALAFVPQAYKLYGKPGDKRYISKMQTYLVLGNIWFALGLAFFGEPFIQIFARDEAYWPAEAVLPALLLANVFFGGRSIVYIALLLKKRVRIAAMTVLVATLVNIALNFLLIPQWGVHGAAWATVLAYALLYVVTMYYAQGTYHIPYESPKLLKALAISIILFLGVEYGIGDWGYAGAALKVALFLAFPFGLYLFGTYEDIELLRLREGIEKAKEAWQNRKT